MVPSRIKVDQGGSRWVKVGQGGGALEERQDGTTRDETLVARTRSRLSIRRSHCIFCMNGYAVGKQARSRRCDAFRDLMVKECRNA